MNESYVTREEFSQLDKRMTRNEVRTDNHEKKLDKIENNTNWILRLIIGIIVTTLMGFLITGGI